jgi:hypothetical protein
VVDWCTSIPLDTPLARLVTADPGTEMIEYDLMRLHKSERVELHTCGRCHHLCIEEYGASSGGGRQCWSVQSIKRKFGLGPASGSQRDLTSTPQRPLCATSGRSITIPGAIICPDFRAPRRNAASPSDQEIDEEAHFYCKMLGRRIDSIQRQRRRLVTG